ncbi:Crp/Fnr family transcriptional regulator [Sphingomicrobium nitratireducens]|uniref:Crp/Fnr family transcriptional regulator n=1 Tax=Sphingomicrobium nitratireducens TaxID=2964666 RepID=UPI00223EF00E|nr:Crp/Fnr family transcriptional regulator [Sphingomicrobium nitratireducens]
MPYSPDVELDDGIRFSENLLLAMMPERLREKLEPHGKHVMLEVGDILFASGDNVEYTFFPYKPTMISLLVDLDDKRRVEVASIGQEGAIGGIVSCGDLPAYTRSEVQVAGTALKIPMHIVEELKRDSLFMRDLYCRYADYLLAQVMQSVACNAFHPIECRAARWLLTAQDRSGDRLELTQEALAGLLGVQRTTVNAVARQLQAEGLISYRRGVITVKDREELEHRSCECYASVHKHFRKVLGSKESSWIASCEA